VQKISSGTRIKVPEIEIDGEKHLFGDVFLDVPIVVELLKINETITIIIDTEIYFDGLSL